MTFDQLAINFLSENAFIVLLAVFIIICILLGVRIVPQSEKFVVERFGRLRSVLGPGINLIVPFLDKVAHKISILERQLPNAHQDAITADNVLVQVETSVFIAFLNLKRRFTGSVMWTARLRRRLQVWCVPRSARWSWMKFNQTAHN